MNRLLFIVFILSVLYSGCGEDPIEAILKKVADDRVINDTELRQIELKPAYKVLCTESKADTTKINTYLTRLKINPVRYVISSPPAKPVFDIYLENSASMDGYVMGKTDFESSIYQFLSDINISTKIADKLNLNYINSKTINFKPEVEDFIDKLEPSTFSLRGGNRGNSDIKNILDTILQNTSDNNVSVFISDCLFSLKNTNNVEDYLVNQSIGIKTIFAQKRKDVNDLAVMVIHLKSDFNGIFYTYDNRKVNLKQERPYYLWFIGKEHYLKNLLKEIDLQKSLQNHVENYFCWFSSNNSINYRTTSKDLIGSFRPVPKNPLHGIEKIKMGSDNSNSVFQFSVAVNLKGIGLDTDYIKDLRNYEVSNSSYEIEGVYEISRDDIKAVNYLKEYTHLIRIRTKQIKSEDLEISLLQNFPDWINQMHWEPQVGVNQRDELVKSFGLKYLLEGLHNAYQGTNSGPKYLFNFSINIEN